MEVALDAAVVKAGRDMIETRARAQRDAEQARLTAERERAAALVAQAGDLPVLERVIKREPVTDAEQAVVVGKGFARVRKDGTLGITQDGYRARNRLLREVQNAQAIRSDQEQVGQGSQEGQPGVQPGAVQGGGNLQQPAPQPADVVSAPGRGAAPGADQLPQGYFRIERIADKKAIGEALKAGNEIPGAELALGEEGLTIRPK